MSDVSVRLTDPIARVPGIAASSARKLAGEGCATAADLLLHVPFRYEDRAAFSPIGELKDGQTAVVSGRVAGHRLIRTRRRRFTILEAAIDDGTGTLRVVWFNRPYLAKALASGKRVVLYGTAGIEKRGLEMRNPEHELFDEEEAEESVHMGRVVGIYRKLGGLGGKWQRSAIDRALRATDPDFRAAGDAGLLLRALKTIHFPPRRSFAAAVSRAREALVREELAVFFDRIEGKREARAATGVAPWTWTAATTRRLLSLLPFPLTHTQRDAMAEIAADFRRGSPMARLLQGDVGSGKTAVAVLAALLAVENGKQAAIMAPTEILAEQHAETIAGWLEGARYRLALLTGRTPPAARRELRAALAGGEIDLLIGTHALIESPVRFADLGLVVVDEQHRFGVEHRARLSRKGGRPHVLVLSATPIPRSLAWTLFGDLDVTRLTEKPAGRAAIRTFVREPARRAAVQRFVGDRLSAGERAYVVVPAIDESEREVAAVESTAETLRRAVPEARVETLHGRQSADRRRAAMAAFAKGSANVLVATTVIEVGIDVPEATVMVVENADRFGLSQLHQLRGRIGRGDRPSYCVLFVSDGATEDARERLAILEESCDGFAIAERDLERRGPGDLLGARQSGMPSFRVADPVRDARLLPEVRDDVRARRARGEKLESDLFPASHAPAPPVIETADA
jgi:ATP-dependent DNA helicase RecG